MRVDYTSKHSINVVAFFFSLKVDSHTLLSKVLKYFFATQTLLKLLQ